MRTRLWTVFVVFLVLVGIFPGGSSAFARNGIGLIQTIRVGLHANRIRIVVVPDKLPKDAPVFTPGPKGALDFPGLMPSPSIHRKLVAHSVSLKHHFREIDIHYTPQNRETHLTITGSISESTPHVFTLRHPDRIVVDFPFSGPVSSGKQKSSGKKADAPPPRPGQKVIVIPGKKVSQRKAPRILPAAFSPSPSLAPRIPRFRVVLDPGHGGKDCGTLGVNGICEKDLVLDIALDLRKRLESDGRFKVLMTRDQDVFIPLKERTDMANRWRGDLFLSIHANSDPNRTVRGLETFLLNLRSSDERSREVATRENTVLGVSHGDLGAILLTLRVNHKKKRSLEFAGDLNRSFTRNLEGRYQSVRNLGIRQAPFYVIMGTAMPAALTEINFLSNPEDARIMASRKYRQLVAQALYRGIVQYYRQVHPEIQAENSRTPLASRP
ncbi:MAG: N-acetylmuramoyl-L-alanine amidase [Nitrospirae bacterium]|nr:N-acetylmuramoyl-L-alanine amidase [Nitrospirota bacterium]